MKRNPLHIPMSTGAAILLIASALAGCSPAATENDRSSAPPSPTTSAIEADARFEDLESRFDSRLGVHAVDTGTGAEVSWRDDERFAYASTIKALAVGALLDRTGLEGLGTTVDIDEADIVDHSPVTEQHTGETMTLEEIAEASLDQSDNTAANYVFDALGGPLALDTMLEEIGDEATTVERIEPELNEATPGDDRDTTTPRAAAGSLREYLLGDTLSTEEKTLLTDWMTKNRTGDTLIRAGVPEEWTVADKSGGGHYGSRGNIAVVWPEEREPIVIAIYSSRSEQDAEYDDRLIAQAATEVVEALG